MLGAAGEEAQERKQQQEQSCWRLHPRPRLRLHRSNLGLRLRLRRSDLGLRLRLRS